MKYSFLPQAQKELDRQVEYYESKQSELGEVFRRSTIGNESDRVPSWLKAKNPSRIIRYSLRSIRNSTFIIQHSKLTKRSPVGRPNPTSNLQHLTCNLPTFNLQLYNIQHSSTEAQPS